MTTTDTGSRDAEFALEYARDRERLQARGVSEADYILSRRVDEGLEELKVNSYPKAAPRSESETLLGNPSAPAAARDAEFRGEFAADRRRLEARGMSEADYVLSRRVDVGLETLGTQQKRRRAAS